ncbi:hypothetical protein NDU88_003388 [Pleurodeles waltl]|uniref:Uncharacterized protein n=1 Tax=Pleurodeles waltl TaxID=8319 RepID=A0AAV7TNX2_PLEWA|nr:hypothetical protein NDU88_003388 [Pleurodeles waltl]
MHKHMQRKLDPKNGPMHWGLVLWKIMDRETVGQQKGPRCSSHRGETDAGHPRHACGQDPGSNGFPIKFVKKYGTRLVPTLLVMFEQAIQKLDMSTDLCGVTVVVIPKNNKLMERGAGPREHGGQLALLNASPRPLAARIGGSLTSPAASRSSSCPGRRFQHALGMPVRDGHPAVRGSHWAG